MERGLVGPDSGQWSDELPVKLSNIRADGGTASLLSFSRREMER